MNAGLAAARRTRRIADVLAGFEELHRPSRHELGLGVDDEVPGVRDELHAHVVRVRLKTLDCARRYREVAGAEQEQRGNARPVLRPMATEQQRQVVALEGAVVAGGGPRALRLAKRSLECLERLVV